MSATGCYTEPNHRRDLRPQAERFPGPETDSPIALIRFSAPPKDFIPLLHVTEYPTWTITNHYLPQQRPYIGAVVLLACAQHNPITLTCSNSVAVLTIEALEPVP